VRDAATESAADTPTVIRRPWLIVVAALLSVGLVCAGAAGADEGPLTVSFGGKGTIASKVEADVLVTVRCAALVNQTDGSVTVSLSQDSGPKQAAGRGSADIACDGNAHNYSVRVFATTGRWHNGTSSATATGVAHGYVTVTDCNGDNTICVTGNVPAEDSGVGGPATITLDNG
jgi:hypothetical protein